MGKKARESKKAATPKRFMKASVPAIDLVDEIKAATEILRKQRAEENAELEYALVTSTKVDAVKDINDEFTREFEFNEQARAAAAEVIPRLKSLGIPTEIPKTYKGERVKDDKQMARIRENLKTKKDSIERAEKVKKLRELKKMGKKIQTEVLKKRSKEKKEFLEKVKKRPVSELFDD